ncbi:MAG: hypothetical protein WAV47_18655, partial [Blastocatellia bacterium]
TSSAQSSSKDSCSGIPDDVWGGDYNSFDALSNRGAAKKDQLSFYFGKFRHDLGAKPSLLPLFANRYLIFRITSRATPRAGRGLR